MESTPLRLARESAEHGESWTSSSWKPEPQVVRGSSSTYHLSAGNEIVVRDPSMVGFYASLRKLARSQISVLILGETGSGKEVAAEALHRWSARSSGPWMVINCAAIPDSLIESELFGYERGAFTDARTAKPGVIESANGGTLFLDEIGELSPAAQAKLLRAVETQVVSRLGEHRERKVDVRIVAATNVDLFAPASSRQFRPDLLFRLAGATVRIPPLRERPIEIPALADRFIAAAAKRLGRTAPRLSADALGVLLAQDFPGNVRELKNAVEYALAVAEEAEIRPGDLPPALRSRATTNDDAKRTTFRPIADELRELERRRIVEALEAFDGVQTRAAAALAMPLRTFTFRMRQYGIESGNRRR
jgi:DNA-binding NtrC family response regulator